MLKCTCNEMILGLVTVKIKQEVTSTLKLAQGPELHREIQTTQKTRHKKAGNTEGGIKTEGLLDQSWEQNIK